MKKNLPILFIFCIFVFLQNPAKAQYVLKEADAQYQLFNYIRAIDLYEQAYKKKATLHAAERLAESYAFVHDYKQTESWYAITVNMPDSKPINVLNYAKALQSNSKYSEAKAQYQKYFTLDKKVPLTEQSKLLASCDSAVKWMKYPVQVSIDDQKSLNSAQSDWGSVKYQNGIVFTSDRVNPALDKQGSGRPFLKFDGSKLPDSKIYGWTGNGYLRLYEQKGKDSVKLFPINAGTDYHVGSASFTEDEKEMFFTLTRIPEKPKFVNGKLATVNVEIFSSKKDGTGTWSAPQPFKYNKVNEYSVGDPFVTKDGNSLYFVSDMPGGKGGTDVYVSIRTDAGDWGTPENLSEINTEGNERSPFFSADNTFYFSSDGRIGMGGLDIFSSVFIGGKISTPKNLGYPFNSPQDDFAYVTYAPRTGYISSNRTSGLGSDDIYHFVEQQILAFKLAGTVLDKNTNAPISNALVTLNKINGGSLKVQTDDDGKFNFSLDKASDYGLTGEKTGYRADESKLSTKNLTSSKTITQNLYLEQIVIGKAIKIENIYYDFDKSNIRPDAAIELDKLVKIMQDNPTIWIELGSHTDSRGNDQYNQWLSQSRANSAVQYIIDKGVSKNRITAKGYGESQLLNKCSNGVKCTEAEHQLNRRTEFKIVKQ